MDLCCIQFRQGCGKGCDGVAEGYSTLQINEDGNMVLCSNVGGICECQEIGGTDTLVDNADGTYTHTALDGTAEIIDICAQLGFCTIGQLGNVDVTADAPDVDQVLTWDGVIWIPEDRGSSFITNAISGTTNYDDLDGNPATDIPPTGTTGISPLAAAMANPSATRDLCVQIIYTGYGANFFFARAIKDLTASMAVQPNFYVDAVLVNNPAAHDALFAFTGGLTASVQMPTGSFTQTIVVAPGGVVNASMDIQMVNFGHNADLAAQINIDPGSISMQGVYC